MSTSTVVVNVGDDDTIYGLSVSPDLDTVLYTLAGVEGPNGWGRARDTMVLMGHLAELGLDTRFRLGDADAAVNLYRTMRLAAGDPLHEIAADSPKHWVSDRGSFPPPTTCYAPR